MIDVVLSALGGVLGWGIAEHLVHENLGHKYVKNRNFFAVEHVRHHATTSYFAPTRKKALVASVTALAVGPIACALAGPRKGLAFTTGLIASYVGYEVLHRRAHTHAPRTAYGRWLRKHHFHHHFHDPSVNHGVTSPLFDHLFRTHHRPGRIRVPARHAMPWLVDEHGALRPEFAADYEIVQKRDKRRAASEVARPVARATT